MTDFMGGKAQSEAQVRQIILDTNKNNVRWVVSIYSGRKLSDIAASHL